jgi:hypothetical protein
MPQRANLTVYQGDDWAAAIAVQNADGTPADLTGYTATAQIRTIPANTAQVVTSFGLGIALPNTINLALSHDQTQALGGSYVWDLQCTETDGTISTLMSGVVRVIPEISQ